MKAKYINPFLSASINLFKEYLGVELTASDPYLNINPQRLLEVSAIIGLAGETVGAVVLSFSRETAVKVVSSFAGKTYQALSKEVIDGVGELVNILAGNAKKDLEDYRLLISLPGVITGNYYKINWPQNVPVITIPFTSSFGDITVNVSLKEERRN
ncbi:MAG: chemotaxis protein CheX [Spirochaetales bacterium]|nr:chemotaxis protein CheX [Spirochaetales bacterium]